MSGPSTTKRHRFTALTYCLALTVPMLFTASQEAAAGSREQAKRIHDRLAGVPPTEDTLNTMTGLIDADPVNGLRDAALEAMRNPNFYNVTLKNWATPWTNEPQTVFEPLNDYTATVIGMIRDDEPFNQMLSADILYVGAGNLGLTPYSMNNNDHYEEMENQNLDLSDNSILVKRTQSEMTSLPSDATSGVNTTRAAAKAFFSAGTNRAMFRFTLLNHLCTDLEQIKDNTRPHDRVRQDVARSPGGDSRIFMNACVGCHAGMDPLAQAYAYYEYDEVNETIVYTPNQVQPKYLINENNFKYGFVTPDDQWDNYWREGPNALLGWDPTRPGTGTGAKSMNEELANSDAFAQCQVKKAFEVACLRAPGDTADRAQISAMTSAFKSGYNMKSVFADAAVYCAGN